METFISGFPQTWAFIDGHPFILTDFEYEQEVETSQPPARQVGVVGQSIEGSGIFFHPNCAPPVFGPDDMPMPLDLEVVAGDEIITFGQTIFSKMEKLPYCEQSAACELEWIAEQLSVERQTKELSQLSP
jgi:hypothetical protein